MDDLLAGLKHQTVTANGISQHFVEMGEGPVVLLCHGFPESWYSWRHQLPALAAAGYHAIAPDMRGYGGTEAPKDSNQYTIFHIIGDMIALLDTLKIEHAVIAGHDWGAPIAWHAALLRPDRFRGVIGLSVPFFPRGRSLPSSVMPRTEDAMFYQLYFQEPGLAEAEFSRDVKLTMRRMLYAASGNYPAEAQSVWQIGESIGMVPLREGFLGGMIDPDLLPSWLKQEDIEFYADEFARTGFRGGLEWYRNFDRNWELMAPFTGKTINIPALYVVGERDMVIAFRGMDQLLPALPKLIPNLKPIVIIPACGHWTMQERPKEVNAAMLTFLRELA